MLASMMFVILLCLSVTSFVQAEETHNVIWNPASIKLKKEVHDYETAGVTIIAASCEEKACTEKGYGVSYAPDLYVYVDYGEYDEYGLGSRHRLGFFGKTSQVKKNTYADFGNTTFRYSRSKQTHQYKVRSNGYYDIQLYDGDTSMYKPNFLGYTYVNVSDFGSQEKLLSGMTNTKVSFDVFGTLKT